jgi:hypothetical protein
MFVFELNELHLTLAERPRHLKLRKIDALGLELTGIDLDKAAGIDRKNVVIGIGVVAIVDADIGVNQLDAELRMLMRDVIDAVDGHA